MTMRIFLLLAVVSGLLAADKQPSGKAFVYKKTEHIDLRLWAHYPSDWQATDHRPAVIFFHGGGWTLRKPTMFAWQAEEMARLGAVAFVADYRSMRKEKASMADLIGDARSAMRYLRQHAGDFGIDPQRIIGAGGSAGGHLISCAATIFDEKFDDPQDDASIDYRPQLLLGFNPVMVKNGPETSPASHVTATTVPTVMCYGTEDKGFLPGALAFQKAMEREGRPFELKLYEGKKHAFFNTMKSQTLHDMLPFVYRHQMLDYRFIVPVGGSVALESLRKTWPGSTWTVSPGGSVADGVFTSDGAHGGFWLQGATRDGEVTYAHVATAVIIDDDAAETVGGTAAVSREPVKEGREPSQFGKGYRRLMGPEQHTTFTWQPTVGGVFELQYYNAHDWGASLEAPVIIGDAAGERSTTVQQGRRPSGWYTIGVVTAKTGQAVTVTFTGVPGSGRKAKPVTADAVRFIAKYDGRRP